MSISDPPPGWRCLQSMAQSAADPHRLSQIVAEMNRLLDQQDFLDEPGETEAVR